jgi:magnesium-transporting ATPase (P-type)
MTTALLLGMTLAFEPNERDIMRRPPRDPKRPLLTAALVKRTGLVSLLLLAGAFGLYWYELASGASLDEARTVATNVFVVVEALYLLNCRSLLGPVTESSGRSNPWIWAGIGAMAVLQLAFTYLPFMNRLFGTAAIGAGAWLRVLGVGALSFVIVTVEKALRRQASVRAARPPASSAGGPAPTGAS